ncbi:MAG TPA: AAA family ATPase [Methanoregula sp.]|nr:AAA family ATPase [Methanoregula sp.]
MLWTEKYRPAAFSDILGQDQVVRLLRSFAKSGSVPHLVMSGPHGTGKSSAIACFARELYGEDWELNTTIFPTADLFLQGRAFLEQDERYVHLYQKNLSLINNFKHILREYASIRPLDTGFKLMVFEDAQALTREAQAVLRRIMERYSPTCRFIFSTTNQSSLIPPVTSRCLPLVFFPVGRDASLRHLAAIRDQEAGGMYPCSDDELELIEQAARGDLRRAILLLQLALETGSCADLLPVSQSETATIASSAFAGLRDAELKAGIRKLESLMIDYGLSGEEVFSEIRSVIRREFNDPLLAIALADAEHRYQHCSNEYIQVGAFAADSLGWFL